MSADSAWALRRNKHGEVVGGGWFVVRRSGTTWRIVVDGRRPPMEYASAADAVRAAQRLADQFPGNAYCVLQMVKMIIKYSATTADTAAGGSGLSPDAGAVASTLQPQLAAAAGDGK